jgi:glycosyltransferase involved in cell wall biosynthesis
MLLVTFNQEQWVEEALYSCLSQTYSPLEIVVSDDASSDRTFHKVLDIAGEYTGPHRLIHNRNQRNLGIGPNVNAAFERSGGDWIVLAAGDDVSTPARVRTLVDAALGSTASSPLVCSANWYIDQNGNRLHDLGVSSLHSPHENDPVRWARALGPIHRGATFMFRRDLVTTFGRLRGDLVNEDLALTFRATLMGGWQFIRAPLVAYRVHDANTHGLLVAGRDRSNILRFKAMRAHRLATVSRQMLADTIRARQLGLISDQIADELRAAARARLTDSLLDARFYLNSLRCSYRPRVRWGKAIDRLGRLRGMEGGSRKGLVHALRALAPERAADLLCRRAARFTN